jgi:hypothetical protein
MITLDPNVEFHHVDTTYVGSSEYLLTTDESMQNYIIMTGHIILCIYGKVML